MAKARARAKQQKPTPASPRAQGPAADEVLDLAEAAEFLKVSKPTFYRWLAQEKVKGFKAGTQWRFYRRDLEQFLRREAPAELHVNSDALAAAVDRERAARGLPPLDWSGLEEGEGNVVVRVVNTLVQDAIRGQASDIHLDATPDGALVRYRVDGVLTEVMRLPREAMKPLVSRLKLMADMEVSDRLRPQHGRITVEFEGREYDLRVTTLPAQFGESAVVRILDQASVLIGLERLGFQSEVQEAFERALRAPQGWIIVSGPSGSGRTSTLYSALNTLNAPTKKIITIEDPVEYRLRDATQVHVNRRAGLTPPVALRHFAHCDPDILLVGDLRDLETAEMCVQAALTGHLVLTAMLPPDAPSALARLLDMGLSPFLVASAVTAVLAQRLVRRLCEKCRVSYQAPTALLADLEQQTGLSLGGSTFYRPGGCDECRQYGYRGRMAVFELLEMALPVKEAVLARAPVAEIRRAALEAGMTTMLQDGLRKAQQGLTSVEEVMRVLGVAPRE